jgi:hypothetical protein
MIPQSSPLPRIITRAIRFGNEAGWISIGNDTAGPNQHSSLFPQESPREAFSRGARP